ncbi:MAG: von Willebrand factor type A domain-containing protein [Planctomycetes bacterium]|nr:von Willebrand factor type A domain-containing protein [Planctomycetota bacterium]
MNTLTHEDPRLTAYALGELPVAERAAIEQLLARNPALRAEVDQIRALSGDLVRELATDLAETPSLTLPQRTSIAVAAQPRRWRAAVGWSVFTTAAAATIVFFIMPSIGLVGERSPEALAMTPMRITSIDQPSTAAPQQETVRVVNHVPVEINISEAAVAAPVNQFDVLLDAQVTTSDGREADFAKGRDEAVTSSETGSTGAFMAIGEGGGTRVRIARSRTDALPPSQPSAAPVAEPAADAATVGMYGRRSGGPPAERTPGARPAAKTEGFRLAPSPTEPTTPAVTPGGEAYNQRADHGFQPALDASLSTFGLDVDTASYGNVRRMIEGGALPPRDAVRVEELVNYFPYGDVPAPANGEAFGVMVEISPCPWQPAHKLARIAVKAKAVVTRPALNLVFLVDVSGSMKPDNRLPLVKTGLSLLANTLNEHDQVTIVTYAGSAGVALPTTRGNDQRAILKAVDRLTADGGTNGGSGIQMAYDAARAGFVRGGVNRVILCTDGDFNVGVTNRDELVRMVQARATEGVFLTVLGVGQDNLKDATMELLADKANGHYHYLDTIAEARKVLIEQLSGTLVTVAKDAKAQVEFNPARIAAWRQLGYEKRQLAAQDFANDRKDAGEIGADHVVTVLYELVPVEFANRTPVIEDGLRYQPQRPPAPVVVAEGHANELLTVKLRYKEPTGSVSKLVQGVVTDEQVRQSPSVDQRFAGAVAAFALRLRGNQAMGMDFPAIASEARRALGSDPQGYRKEFVNLVERAAAIQGTSPRE